MDDRLARDPAGHHEWTAGQYTRRSEAGSTYRLELSEAAKLAERISVVCGYDDAQMLIRYLSTPRSLAELRVEFGYKTDEEVRTRLELLIDLVCSTGPASTNEAVRAPYADAPAEEAS